MNLWLRMLWTIAASLWRPRFDPRLEPSRLDFRVWPLDLDLNGHMNNGRYLTIMDLGRLDLVLRSGLWRIVWRHRWSPMLGTAAIRYRRELRLGRRFTLETRLAYWTGSTIVFEQTFLREGEVAARALMKAGIYDRKARAFVTVRRIIEELGAADAESPPPSPEIEAFLAADTSLRRVAQGGQEDA
jgi:acyl-CoA thioesterase FadM